MGEAQISAPVDDDNDELVPLTVALNNHPFASCELLFGEALRGDANTPNAFVLRCIPRFAYGLNWGDHVRTDGVGAGRTIRKVLVRSGHTTLRVTFLRRVLPRDRGPILEALRALGVSYEGSVMDTVAVDVPPTTDLQGVLAQLSAWDDAGALYFETGKARVKGSFDAAPAPDAAAAMQAMLDASTAYEARREP